ncbi:MAG: PAS domain S-box protein [Chloroflexi bacterium]|nr:PAS domain S-box protein [Chloroflexota bacterium]
MESILNLLVRWRGGGRESGPDERGEAVLGIRIEIGRAKRVLRAGRAVDRYAALESEAAVVESLAILDSPPEAGFDRLTRLACRVLKTPISLVTLSDGERHLLKSAVGLPERWVAQGAPPITQPPLEHAVAGEAPLVVTDVRQHALARHDPSLTELGIAAYACVPLQGSDGRGLGAFTVADVTPREWTEADLETLRELAASVTCELELRTAGTALRRERSEREAAERGSQFLAEAGAVLAGSLDYETTLANVARLAVAYLADWCSVYLLGSDGCPRAIGGAHANPEKTPLVEEVQRRYPPVPDGQQSVSEVLWSGRPVLWARLEDEEVARLSRDAEHARLRRLLGFRSVLSVPLTTHGKLLGAIMLARGTGREPYRQAELALAEELARRAALAVDNALLYRQAQDELTERRLAEAQLRQSRDQLDIVLRGVADRITAQDASGRLVYANEAAARGFGFDTVAELLATSPEEVVGRFEIRDEAGNPLPPEQLPRRRALREGRECEATVRFRRRGSHDERWSVVRATPMCDETGAVSLSITIARDVTEQRRAEAELRRAKDELEVRVAKRTAELQLANEQLRIELLERRKAEQALLDREAQLCELFDEAPVGYVELDLEGRITRVNRTRLEMLGYDEAEMLGRYSWDFVVDADAARREYAEKVSTGRTRHAYERTFVRKDGTLVPTIMENRILYDAEGRIRGVRSTAQDISERKRVEQKLARLDRLYTVLREINEVIARVRDRNLLLVEACRIAVEQGQLRLAWICLIEGEEPTLRPAAHFGADFDHVAQFCITRRDEPLGQGVTGTAVRLERTDVCNDVERDGRIMPWRELALQLGYRSGAAFPLRQGDVVIGALTVLAREVGFFDADEIMVLERLAANLSFALERIAQDEQLRFQKALLEAQSEASLDGICVVSSDREIISTNRRFAEMWELPPEIMQTRSGAPVRRRQLELVATPEAFAARTESHYASEDAIETDQVELKNGNVYERYTAPVRGADGTCYGRVWYLRDVTLRRQREEQLRASEMRFRHLFDEAPVGYHELDTDGRISRVNMTELKMLGYEEAEMLGQPVWTFLVDQEEALRSVLARLAGDTPAWAIERLYRRKDGAEVPVLLEGRQMRDQAGRVTGIRTVIRDISERKQAELERARLSAQVERERATLAAVMASMADGLVVLDAKGRVRYCNARAGTLLGLDAGTSQGRPFRNVWRTMRRSLAEPIAEWDAWAAALAHPEEERTIEIVMSHPKRRDVQAQTFQVTDGAGTRSGVGLLLRDVTKERELDQAKDDIVAMISHELRTPLGVVKGYATTLLLPDGPDDAKTRRHCLRIIAGACDELQKLVDNLLDISRLRAGAFEVELRPVRLETLVDEIVSRQGAYDPRPPVDVAIPAGLPRVLADPRRLEQVFTNLLDNAYKYSTEGGRVTIEAEAGDGEVIVSIADEGMGVPAEELERMFERFHRGKNGRILGIGGAGLGLAIAKEIVSAHGGRIWAESPVPGRALSAPPGTVFRFTLPAARQQNGRAPQSENGHISGES